MKKTIEIDGKEYEVLGTVRESDGFGVHTIGGTFRMKPCKPKAGQSVFWMGENGFVIKELPGECPERISRITFDEPDLTDQFPEEVEADYQTYKKHCEEAGEKMLSFEQYKTQVAVLNVWTRHETPELALQYGYVFPDFYYRNLEGQKIDPACINSNGQRNTWTKTDKAKSFSSNGWPGLIRCRRGTRKLPMKKIFQRFDPKQLLGRELLQKTNRKKLWPNIAGSRSRVLRCETLQTMLLAGLSGRSRILMERPADWD